MPRIYLSTTTKSLVLMIVAYNEIIYRMPANSCSKIVTSLNFKSSPILYEMGALDEPKLYTITQVMCTQKLDPNICIYQTIVPIAIILLMCTSTNYEE